MRRYLRGAVVIGIACAAWIAPSTLDAALSETERTVIELVDAGVDDAIALLERLVNINSGTQNLAGVRAVGEALTREFEALGLRTRWIPGDGFGRAGHLVAEKDGAGPRILLIGHLDTVFQPDSPFQRFERVDEWTAKGPGIIDMKGGDVILLLALKALKEAGLLHGASLAVILTGDEEATGNPLDEARAELIALATAAKFAIGFEDGDGDPAAAVISRRGSTTWILRATGVRAHSSLIFTEDVGDGAIYEAARVLRGFHAIREPHLTMSPGVILGGTELSYDDAASRGEAFGKSNVTAQLAVVKGDLRAFTMEQRKLVKERMQSVVRENLPRTGVELTFRDGHTVHETADLRVLPVQAKRAALLIHRLTEGAFDE